MDYLRWIGALCLAGALAATLTRHPYVCAPLGLVGFACLILWRARKDA